MKRITVFECSHCGLFYKKTRKSVEAHEERCFYNPETKSCASCLFLLEAEGPKCILGFLIAENKLRTRCDGYADRDQDLEEVLRQLPTGRVVLKRSQKR